MKNENQYGSSITLQKKFCRSRIFLLHAEANLVFCVGEAAIARLEHLEMFGESEPSLQEDRE
jgi:hypothetical protein